METAMQIQTDKFGYRLDNSREAFAHNAKVLRKSRAAIKAREREEHNKQFVPIDPITSGEFDNTNLKGPAGSSERLEQLKEFYNNPNNNGLSPFILDAGAMAISVLQLTDTIKVKEVDIEDKQLGETYKVLTEERVYHPTKKAVLELLTSPLFKDELADLID